MYILPEVQKLKSEDELKVDNAKKHVAVQSMGAELHKLKLELIKLQSSNDELNTAANMNMQKINHEVRINKTLYEEKEGMEKKLADSIATNKSL